MNDLPFTHPKARFLWEFFFSAHPFFSYSGLITCAEHVEALILSVPVLSEIEGVEGLILICQP
jgi:hypothetical protein